MTAFDSFGIAYSNVQIREKERIKKHIFSRSGLHPTTISDAFQEAATKCCDILMEMATPVDLSDRQSLLQSASTSLNSKVVSQHSSLLSPMAVDAVLEVN